VLNDGLHTASVALLEIDVLRTKKGLPGLCRATVWLGMLALPKAWAGLTPVRGLLSANAFFACMVCNEHGYGLLRETAAHIVRLITLSIGAQFPVTGFHAFAPRQRTSATWAYVRDVTAPIGSGVDAFPGDRRKADK
jgi:hypothetical protein